jgi:hypothetical protein
MTERNPIEDYLTGNVTTEQPDLSAVQQAQQEQPEPEQETKQETQDASPNETDNPDLAVSEAKPSDDEEEIIVDEDEPVSVASTTAESPFSKAKDILGFEVSSLDDIKTVLSKKDEEYQAQLSKLKDAATLVQSDELKGLAEHVQKGGKISDYKDAVTEIDNLKLQAEQLRNITPDVALKAYLKEDVGLNDEQIEDYMATKSDVEITIEGKKLLKQWETHINGEISSKVSNIENIKKTQTERYNNLVKGISDTIESSKSVLGVSVTPSEKAMLKQIAAHPLKAIQEFFPVDEHGNYQADIWAKNLMTLKLAHKKADVLKRKAASDGARQVVEGRANLPKPNQASSVKTPELDALSSALSSYMNT